MGGKNIEGLEIDQVIAQFKTKGRLAEKIPYGTKRFVGGLRGSLKQGATTWIKPNLRQAHDSSGR